MDSLSPAEFPAMRIRCYDCYRPKPMCFCDIIPDVDNRTEILLLQHRRERFHAFNTARIVRKSLNRSQLLVDHNNALNRRFNEFPLSDQVGVLYPGPGGQLLTDVPPAKRPEQLIVIDGTWHHAKTLLRDMPRLNELPRYRIQPTEPGNYRIRREPNETALSTLEATVAALRALEPETQGFDELIAAFDTMVQSQLDHPTARSNWRQNENRHHNEMAIPHAIRGNAGKPTTAGLSNVVVVYGESEPGRVGCKRAPRGQDPRQPIYVVARRLDTDQSLRVAIDPPFSLPTDFLNHIGLSEENWHRCRSLQGFREDWHDFIRPTDTVVAHHPSTLRLLRNAGADVGSPIVLKSIQYDPTKQHATLEAFLHANQIAVTAPPTQSRADQRLANAIALTYHLHQLGCE